MELTREQQALLDGAEGPVVAKYFRLLTTWGEAMGARRMVRVDNVHCSGISAPANTADGMPDEAIQRTLSQVEEFLSVPVKVPTSTHVARMSLDRLEQEQPDSLSVRMQHRVIEKAREAGIALTWTCVPYEVGIVPSKGQICVWTESSAVVYVNSILGARSTRNGAESAIAAAMTGWFPEFGVLLTENRGADIQIDVQVELGDDPCDWGALGYFGGLHAGLDIPVYTGVPAPSLDQGKHLSASHATSGGVTMFHIAGVTPEAPTLDAALRGKHPRQTLVYTEAERTSMFERLNTLTASDIDFVVVGCPHASIEEIRMLATLLEGRKIHSSVHLELCTPWAIYSLAERLGYVDIVRKAGGHIMPDTCPSVARMGVGRRMATNSFKQAHYIQGMLGHEVVVGPLSQVVDAAVTGRWNG